MDWFQKTGQWLLSLSAVREGASRVTPRWPCPAGAPVQRCYSAPGEPERKQRASGSSCPRHRRYCLYLKDVLLLRAVVLFMSCMGDVGAWSAGCAVGPRVPLTWAGRVRAWDWPLERVGLAVGGSGLPGSWLPCVAVTSKAGSSEQ